MKFMVFTTAHCPRCPAVKDAIAQLLARGEGFHAEFVSADTEEGLQKARHYGVSQVPTVILFSDDEEIARIHSVEELELHAGHHISR